MNNNLMYRIGLINFQGSPIASIIYVVLHERLYNTKVQI